jgi:hypothetical protein
LMLLAKAIESSLFKLIFQFPTMCKFFILFF